MDAEVTLTLVGSFPNDLQVGDVLQLDGSVTVHTIAADMLDCSEFNARGAKTYLPAVRTVGVYSNEMRFLPSEGAGAAPAA